jgi:hypothetical protein
MKQSPRKKGRGTLKERMNKHISDKNDVITDEDIRNVQIGEDVSLEATESAQELAQAIEEKKQTSPWHILSEEDK